MPISFTVARAVDRPRSLLERGGCVADALLQAIELRLQHLLAGGAAHPQDEAIAAGDGGEGPQELVLEGGDAVHLARRLAELHEPLAQGGGEGARLGGGGPGGDEQLEVVLLPLRARPPDV